MIARNAAVNLIGHVTPLAAALFFVPPLVARLDPDRFGFLTLAWVLIGYFSLFDLGFARALSRLIAERRETAPPAWIDDLSRTALTLTLALGVVAGGALFLLADVLCVAVLRIPVGLQDEAALALRVLAACVPLVTLTAVLRGVLEAGRRFGWVNALRIPMGVLLFAAPLLVALWRTDLVWLSAGLALVRAVAFVAHWMVCVRFYPTLTSIGRPRRFAVREMLGYGAWVTVSNVVGPILLYVDRFALGTFVALSAVAYYTMPYEVVTRVWIIPAALAGVLFPIMAALPDEHLARLYRIGIKAVLIAVFPVALAIVVFAPDWLNLWLGEEYSNRGTGVAQVLCFGIAINCLAYIPATIIQARGRADLIAKMHLAELPVFIALLLLLIPTSGAEGAAAATAIRCVLDAVMVFWMARRIAPEAQPQLRRPQIAVIVLAGLALLLGASSFSLLERVAYFAASLFAFGVLAWYVLLDSSERSRARRPMELLTADLRR